jgi:hypothetical protein
MTKSIRVCLRFTPVIAAIIVATPASAIDCVGGYQRVQGNLIATPYCQDEQLAQVAREYGISASGAKIRNNPNYKKEICRTVWTDNRVQITCENAGIPERVR